MTDQAALDVVFEAAWKSLIVAGAVLLLLALLKKRSAAERACVAHFGMAAVLLVPVLVAAGPSLEVEFLASEPPPVISAPAALVEAPAQMPVESAVLPLDAPAPPVLSAVEMAGERADLGFILYLVPAALLLLLTFVAVLRLFALRSRASVIVEQSWLTALAHAQRRMGIKSGTALLASRELSSPVSWGVLRPIILLSEETLAKRIDAEAIIAHELAHVARFDWLNLLIARITTAVFWFNPLVWLLARQGHQLREEAADDAVLRADVSHTDYAALLVEAARNEGRGILLVANGVAPRKGSLSLRVRRILEPTLRRAPARLGWGSSCAAGALLIAAPLAALTPAEPEALASPMAAVVPPSTTAPAAFPAPFAPAAAPVFAAPPAPPAATRVPGMPAAAHIAAASPAAVAAAVPVAPLAAPAAHAGPEAIPAPVVRVAPTVTISPEALVALRAHGMNAETLSDYVAAYPRLRRASAEQLTSLRVHHVSPQRLRQYAALGYNSLDADRLIEWGVHGVTPGYIQGIAQEGYRGLSPEQLTEFRIMGVTADFIRRVKQAGLTSLSAERMVEMRIHGVPRPSAPPPVPPPTRYLSYPNG